MVNHQKWLKNRSQRAFLIIFCLKLRFKHCFVNKMMSYTIWNGLSSWHFLFLIWFMLCHHSNWLFSALTTLLLIKIWSANTSFRANQRKLSLPDLRMNAKCSQEVILIKKCSQEVILIKKCSREVILAQESGRRWSASCAGGWNVTQLIKKARFPLGETALVRFFALSQLSARLAKSRNRLGRAPISIKTFFHPVENRNFLKRGTF